MKAVIMAGGQGTRFWPASRESLPKQFLRIAGSRTMLQETAERLHPLLGIEDIYVVCGERYVGRVRQQLDQIGEEQIIIEPAARNTAPCVGLSALYLRRHFPREVMAVLPSDHVIQDRREFHQALQAAEIMARQGWLVTFGIQPTYPATGYGYLKQGDALGTYNGCSAHRVLQFAEKPSRSRAEKFLKAGSYCWNSGMFVWSIDRILEEINTHLPELGGALKEIEREGDREKRCQEIFSCLQSISIDYGVMEKSDRVAMIPCGLGWNDVGDWKALEKIRPRDKEQITANTGCYLNIDSRNCVVYTSSEDKLLALVGVENVVLVETEDAILVCHRERTEDVRKVVQELREKGWEKYL